MVHTCYFRSISHYLVANRVGDVDIYIRCWPPLTSFIICEGFPRVPWDFPWDSPASRGMSRNAHGRTRPTPLELPTSRWKFPWEVSSYLGKFQQSSRGTPAGISRGR